MSLKNALQLSPFIAGMWRLAEWNMSPQRRLELINQCIDIGVTSFDHADIYGDYQCEKLFGEALTLSPSLRTKMQLVSKCGIRLLSANKPEHKAKRYDTSYQHIVNSVETSLRLLTTDYLDCILIHRPDPLMDAAEIARAFADLKHAGKILHAGVSNFLPHQLELLQSACDFPLAVNQIEVSVLHTDTLFDGSLDYCQQHKVQPMAWSPLAGGDLFKGETEQAIRVMSHLNRIADTLSVNIVQVAMAWLLRHPANIKPIIGSGNFSRIRSAVQATSVTLDDDDWYAILEASQNASLP